MTEAVQRSADAPRPVTEPVSPQAAPGAGTAQRYFNRELSWLAFNQRVLDRKSVV